MSQNEVVDFARLASPENVAFRNVMSVDVEDYFHAESCSRVVKPAEWDGCPPRVEYNTQRILELFARLEIQATFFVLGWVAQRYPALVRQITKAGHELACHSYRHQLVYNLPPEVFREDTRQAKDLIQQAAGESVYGYRAPTFSIDIRSLWALDILAELGFTYDSSIFPIYHDRYGVPHAPRFPFRVATSAGPLIEYPLSTFRLWGKHNFPVAGGGYLRLLPQWYTRLGKRRAQKERLPVIAYVHPWEIDEQQPRLKLGFKSGLRHYTNLGRMYGRLAEVLSDGDFTSFRASGLAALAQDYDISVWRQNDSR
jgi:polysaccharide deacetylase family protein (PEP-CTERM system associated)